MSGVRNTATVLQEITAHLADSLALRIYSVPFITTSPDQVQSDHKIKTPNPPRRLWSFIPQGLSQVQRFHSTEFNDPNYPIIFFNDRNHPARNISLAYHPPIRVQGGRHLDVVARISPNHLQAPWRLDFLVAPRAEPDWFVTKLWSSFTSFMI